MAVPDLLRQHVDEADAVVDRALVHRIGREEAVDVVGAQVRHHLRRRHRADLDVAVRIEAVLRHVVAQQVVVHRVVERHGELEALPGLRVAPVLVLDRERDRLAVDVLDRGHGVGHRARARAQRDGERHRREHVRGVVFLVQRLVADHRPARGLHHLDVEPVLRVEAHRVRHDDRRRAGDRDEADLELLLLELACALRERFLGAPSGKSAEMRGQRGAGARPRAGNAGAAPHRERGAHHRLFDTCVARRRARPASSC